MTRNLASPLHEQLRSQDLALAVGVCEWGVTCG